MKLSDKRRIVKMLAWNKTVNGSCFLNEYMYKFSARMSELRADGFTITAVRTKKGCHDYEMVSTQKNRAAYKRLFK